MYIYIDIIWQGRDGTGRDGTGRDGHGPRTAVGGCEAEALVEGSPLQALHHHERPRLLPRRDVLCVCCVCVCVCVWA
jgi:hypothetical protein